MLDTTAPDIRTQVYMTIVITRKKKKIIKAAEVIICSALAVLAVVYLYYFANYSIGNRLVSKQDGISYYSNLICINVEGGITDGRVYEIEQIIGGKCDDIDMNKTGGPDTVYILTPTVHSIEGLKNIGNDVQKRLAYITDTNYADTSLVK